MRYHWAAAKLMLTASAASCADLAVKTPGEAIAIADAASANGVTGFYEMTVVASEKTDHATFLNSTADYKGPDNLTFTLTPAVAVALKKRFGVSPEDYLKGKRLVVYGAVQAHKIFDTFEHRIRSVNRIAHGVYIQHASQIVTVDEPSAGS